VTLGRFAGAVAGVGIDIVDVARFEATLARTPALRTRLFTPGERNLPTGSLAARFAAKEALAKALGAPAGLNWLDADVVREDSGQPTLVVTGTVAACAAERGVARFHLSPSHDGGFACAVVVAETAP
jgi:holo-[acyl-carrier protein] synthase